MIRNLDKLLDYADTNNIDICYEEKLADFNKSALYCNIQGKDLILLSDLYNSKELDHKLEILSEEIGHYKTSYGDDFKPEYSNSLEKLIHDKSEFKACRSGFNILVDDNVLREAFLKGTTPDDVVEKTGLSISIINRFLKYYSLSNSLFLLSEDKALDLNKLPGWIIVDI